MRGNMLKMTIWKITKETGG